MGLKEYLNNRKEKEKETNQPLPEEPETITCPNCKKELNKKTIVKRKYVCYE